MKSNHSISSQKSEKFKSQLLKRVTFFFQKRGIQIGNMIFIINSSKLLDF